MTISLELKDISKSFGNKMIYKNVSFSFRPGCYLVTGENGSGKTVLLEMLAGILRQDTGSIHMQGTGDNISLEYKQKLTYIPGKPSFFPTATGNEFLSFIMSVKKTGNDFEKINYMIDGFGLAPHLNTKFQDMSLGTQKKLFLATLSMDNSGVIVLDEPTNALDDASKNFLLENIKKLSKNSIVIIASHDKNLISVTNPILIKINNSPTTELCTGTHKEMDLEII